MADIPWCFRDALNNRQGVRRGAVANYRTMPEGLAEDYLDRQGFAIADDAFLFLWRVGALQEQAFGVMRSWGFRFSGAEIVWVKTTDEPRVHSPYSSPVERTSVRLAFGMGHYVRNCHEVCLVGVRGRAKVQHRSQRSVFFAPAGPHSAKPDEFYRIVEKLCRGPRLELFGRKRRAGWTVVGDEIE